jgi:hypothetical protein
VTPDEYGFWTNLRVNSGARSDGGSNPPRCGKAYQVAKFVAITFAIAFLVRWFLKGDVNDFSPTLLLIWGFFCGLATGLSCGVTLERFRRLPRA